MEENFDLLAQSRANYFTKGSPVQFVKVELLKGDVSGDIAVCLSFKNISAAPLAQLQITFKCKDRSGAVVCQDQFLYEGLNAAHGEVFGADDAVYISSSPIGSVEVELGTARFADGRTLDLTSYPRVRLAPPKKLPAELAEKLCERTRKEGLTVVPQVLDEGWYCACGAFHPREEDGVWCIECGSARILLQNTLSSLLQGGSTAPATDDEPTRMVPPVRQEEPTRTVPPVSPRPAPAAPVSPTRPSSRPPAASTTHGNSTPGSTTSRRRTPVTSSPSASSAGRLPSPPCFARPSPPWASCSPCNDASRPRPCQNGGAAAFSIP